MVEASTPLQQHRRPMRRAYRGIFSSSLCSMFETPAQSRTDACALACCGIWLWERNQYLLSGTKPKSCKERRFELTILVLAIVLLVVYSQYPSPVILRCLVFVTIAGGVWRLLRFQQARNDFRIALAKDQYARENPNEQHDEDHHQLQDGQVRFLHEHQREIQKSHPFCGCNKMDLTITDEGSDEAPPSSDFCSVLWQCLASTCCGTCCVCWFQFCGMCAIAQEHRQLRRILPNTPELWQCDYITFQPWSEYFSSIQQLRESAQGSFFAHAQALSQLSLRLSIGVEVILGVILVVTLLPLHLFSAWNYLVVRTVEHLASVPKVKLLTSLTLFSRFCTVRSCLEHSFNLSSYFILYTGFGIALIFRWMPLSSSLHLVLSLPQARPWCMKCWYRP
jgi:hypothetical protein